MTDKVQRIRKEVERLRYLHQMKYQQLDADSSMSLVECGKRNLCNELLSFIDSLQEEQKPALSENEGKQKQDVSIQINPSEYINDMGGNGYYLKNVTQVSDWSEEDYIEIKRITGLLEGWASTFEKTYYEKECKRGVDWLKSLGDRVKDNELTWEDIPEIFRISEQLKTSWWFMDNEQTKLIGTQVFWEEVLKRFKENRGNNYDNCKDKER